MRRHIDRHIDKLKEKPEHVRQRVAIGAAGGITGLIAIVWLVTTVSSGSFALKSEEPEPVTNDVSSELAETRSNFSQLLGAVGGSLGATSSDPQLTIVDGGSTSTLAPTPASNQDATAIAF